MMNCSELKVNARRDIESPCIIAEDIKVLLVRNILQMNECPDHGTEFVFTIQINGGISIECGGRSTVDEFFSFADTA